MSRSVLVELEKRKIDLRYEDAPRLIAPDDQRLLFDSLLLLLRNHADIDLSVIAVTAPNLKRKFLGHVRHRCRLEFQNLLTTVRATMEKAYYDWQCLTGRDESGVSYHVQTVLDPFIVKAETLIKNITGPITDNEIYDQVRKVFADPQNPNLTIILNWSMEMSKYKITGGQQGAVGDESHAENFVQQQTVGTSIDIPDLLALSQELSRESEAKRKKGLPLLTSCALQQELPKPKRRPRAEISQRLFKSSSLRASGSLAWQKISVAVSRRR